MNYQEWRPLYLKIIEHLGIDEKKDKESRNILNKEITTLDKEVLEKSITDKVVVYGNSPGLEKELTRKEKPSKTKISADSATQALLNQKTVPNIVVTDLDGNINAIRKAQKNGAIIVVHSHGDNIKKIRKWVSKLNPIVGTTQTEPKDNVHNFGGFTDGDRSIFLAEHFGAKDIELVGFDFKAARGEKLKKLKIAKKLVSYLEKNKEVTIHHRHQ